MYRHKDIQTDREMDRKEQYSFILTLRSEFHPPQGIFISITCPHHCLQVDVHTIHVEASAFRIKSHICRVILPIDVFEVLKINKICTSIRG